MKIKEAIAVFKENYPNVASIAITTKTGIELVTTKCGPYLMVAGHSRCPETEEDEGYVNTPFDVYPPYVLPHRWLNTTTGEIYSNEELESILSNDREFGNLTGYEYLFEKFKKDYPLVTELVFDSWHDGSTPRIGYYQILTYSKYVGEVDKIVYMPRYTTGCLPKDWLNTLTGKTYDTAYVENLLKKGELN